MLHIAKKASDYLVPRLFYTNTTVAKYFRKKGCQIGRDTSISIKSMGQEPWLIKIGDNCTITGGVQFITHDGGTRILRKKHPGLSVFGKIEIRDNSFIGMNTILMPNVTIGPNSVVGAGSVVTKNVPPECVAAGNPAKVICSLPEYEKKCLERFDALGIKGKNKKQRKVALVNFFKK